MSGLPWLQILLACVGGVLLLGIVFWIGWRESRRPFPARDEFPVETGDEDPPMTRGPRR